MNKFSVSVLAVTLSACSFYSSVTHAADNYEIIDLGKFEDGNSSIGFSINSTNQVVGYSVRDSSTGFSRGFLYDSGNSDLIDLGAIDNSEVFVEITNTVDGVETTESVNVGIDTGTSSLIFDVNNDALAVGFSVRIFGSVSSTENDDGTTTETAVSRSVERAIYVDSNSLQLNEIPDFIENNTSQNMRAIAITNNYVVGTGSFDEPEDLNDDGSANTTLFDRGFIYDTTTQDLVKISPLNGDLTRAVTIRDIDSSGYAVGISTELVDNIIYARVVGVNVSSPDTITDLNISGGAARQVWSINENKKIVGKTRLSNSVIEKAYMYDISISSETDLGVLNTNFPFSEAFDINDSDQVVGVSQTTNQPRTLSGFIYENGEMKDLSKMIGCNTGWTIHEARSINNDGYITGTGLFNGESRAFMLRPLAGTAPVCEEESTLSGSGAIGGLLSLFSLMSLILVRRRYLIK